MGINFGEDLAYWYLRLNGFFTINNFVLHKSATANIEFTADSDILAVRPASVSESIEDIQLPIDSRFRECWNMSVDQKLIGLIVEVKTGHKLDTSKCFAADRLQYAIKRLGKPIASVLQNPSMFQTFIDQQMVSDKRFDLAKLLIYDSERNQEDLSSAVFYRLTLKDVQEFVRFRLTDVTKELSFRKDKDRLFFPDTVIQHLIWNANNQ